MGFREYRGSDEDTWGSMGKLFSASASPGDSDVASTNALMVHGADPDAIYRAFTKAGFRDQVTQHPSAIAGDGTGGQYAGNPPATTASSLANVLWMPEGPRQGSTDIGDGSNQQLYRWTGGILLDGFGVAALVGGHTDMADKFLIRPFPDPQRRSGHIGQAFEVFVAVATSSAFDEDTVVGDPNWGCVSLTEVKTVEYSIDNVHS